MYIGPLQVIKTDPVNYMVDVMTNEPVKVYFNSYIDTNTLDMAVLVTTSAGIPINCTLKLNQEEKRLDIIPSYKAWESNTTYFITIVGQDDTTHGTTSQACLKDVSGEAMPGSTKLTFTTVSVKLLDAPQIISPINKTIYTSVPEFSWQAVGDDPNQLYELVISSHNIFSPLLWSNNNVESTGPISPNIEFPDGIIYWRVRAVKGQWSDIQQFNLSIYGEAPISPEDTLNKDTSPYYIEGAQEITEVLDTYPEADFSNVSTYLKVITIHVNGPVDIASLTADNFTITGEAIDGQTDNDIGQVIPETIEVRPQLDGTTLIVLTLPDLVVS